MRPRVFTLIMCETLNSRRNQKFSHFFFLQCVSFVLLRAGCVRTCDSIANKIINLKPAITLSFPFQFPIPIIRTRNLLEWFLHSSRNHYYCQIFPALEKRLALLALRCTRTRARTQITMGSLKNKNRRQIVRLYRRWALRSWRSPLVAFAFRIFRLNKTNNGSELYAYRTI